MDINDLDKLDEQNRLNDLHLYLKNERGTEDDDYEDDSNSTVRETRYDMYKLNEQSQHGKEMEHQRSLQPGDEFYDMVAVLMSGNNSGDSSGQESAGEITIRRLINTLHVQRIELNTTQLTASHMKLQIQAMTSHESDLRNEIESLHFALTEAEQDKLLLKAKLKEISRFETGQSKDITADEIRGKLLQAANDRIADLTEALNECIRDHEKKTDEITTEYKNIEFENISLKKELKALTDQLAQRAVLYAAQERRYFENSHLYEIQHHDHENELISTKTSLEQCQHQLEKVDRERIEAIFSYRQAQEKMKLQDSEREEMKERIQNLEDELADVSSQNLQLQSTVNRLRSSDMEDMERGMSFELETIRNDFKHQEDALKRQLDEAREMIESLVLKNENCYLEITTMQRTMTSMHQGEFLQSQQTPVMNAFVAIPHSVSTSHPHLNSDKQQENKSFLSVDSKKSGDDNWNKLHHMLNFVDEEEVREDYPGRDHHPDQQIRTSSQEEIQVGDSTNSEQWLLHQIRNTEMNHNQKSKSPRYSSLLEEEEHCPRMDEFHTQVDPIPKDSLHPAARIGVSNSSYRIISPESNSKDLNNSTIQNADLTNQLQVSAEKELLLQSEVNNLKRCLRMVLQKAAEKSIVSQSEVDHVLDADEDSSVPATANPMGEVNGSHSVQRKPTNSEEWQQIVSIVQREKNLLMEKVQMYKDEFKQLEKQLESQKQLGRHEAATEYEIRTKELEETLSICRSSLNHSQKQCLHSLEQIENYQQANALLKKDLDLVTKELQQVQETEGKNQKELEVLQSKVIQYQEGQALVHEELMTMRQLLKNSEGLNRQYLEEIDKISKEKLKGQVEIEGKVQSLVETIDRMNATQSELQAALDGQNFRWNEGKEEMGKELIQWKEAVEEKDKELFALQSVLGMKESQYETVMKSLEMERDVSKMALSDSLTTFREFKTRSDADFERISKQNQEIKSELDTIRHQLNEQELEISSLKVRLSQFEATSDSSSLMIKNLLKKLDETSHELKRLRTEFNEMTDREANLELCIEDYKQRNNELLLSVSELDRRNRDLVKHLDTQSGNFIEIEKELQTELILEGKSIENKVEKLFQEKKKEYKKEFKIKMQEMESRFRSTIEDLVSKRDSFESEGKKWHELVEQLQDSHKKKMAEWYNQMNEMKLNHHRELEDVTVGKEKEHQTVVEVHQMEMKDLKNRLEIAEISLKKYQDQLKLEERLLVEEDEVMRQCLQDWEQRNTEWHENHQVPVIPLSSHLESTESTGSGLYGNTTRWNGSSGTILRLRDAMQFKGGRDESPSFVTPSTALITPWADLLNRLNSENNSILKEFVTAKEEWNQEKLKIISKYRKRIIQYKEHFAKEKETMLKLVRKECEDIINGTKQLILLHSKKKHHPPPPSSTMDPAAAVLITPVSMHDETQRMPHGEKEGTTPSTMATKEYHHITPDQILFDHLNDRTVGMTSPLLGNSSTRDRGNDRMTLNSNDHLLQNQVKTNRKVSNVDVREEGDHVLLDDVTASHNSQKSKQSFIKSHEPLSRRSEEIKIYPEMISPTATRDMIQNIMGRTSFSSYGD